MIAKILRIAEFLIVENLRQVCLLDLIDKFEVKTKTKLTPDRIIFPYSSAPHRILSYFSTSGHWSFLTRQFYAL